MNAISGLPMPDAVTVLVSTELLDQLTEDWSPLVQVRITKTPGIGSGYEMTVRTTTRPERLSLDQYCELMHDAYERAAIGAGWDTNPASRKPWADIPEANKQTMRAAVGALLEALTPTN